MPAADDGDDARAWLRPSPLLTGSQGKLAAAGQRRDCGTGRQTRRKAHDATQPAHGRTDTMAKAGEFQNMLTAVMHPLPASGYKDGNDPCNRTDRHNGGDFRRFESTYSKAFASVHARPVQFRRDGLPISARRVAGSPLMAPKLPSTADLTESQRLCQRYNHQRSITVVGSSSGGGSSSSGSTFKSVYSLVHTAPHRSLGQPNPGIAAEDAARSRKQLGLFA